MWITMLISCVKSVYMVVVYSQFEHSYLVASLGVCVYVAVYTFFIQASSKSYPFNKLLFNALHKAKFKLMRIIHTTQYYCYLYIFNTIVISNKG